VTMIVSAGRADQLAADLEAAIARGARCAAPFELRHRRRARPAIAGGRSHRRAGRLSCDPAWRTAMSGRLQSSSLRTQLDEGSALALRSNPVQPPSSGLFRYDRNDCWRPIADTGGQPLLADVAGVNAPLADAAGKTALFAATGAAAVDMESAIVARAAQRHGLPFAILRVIADPAHRPLPSAALVAMREDGEVDLPAVLDVLIRDPRQLPALIRLALDSGSAFSALVRARALLGSDFASLDLG
jgi:hypothetical protein